MKSSSDELDAESWAFALAIYARAGVAEACIALQNATGVDVILLLMVTFAAVRRRILLTPDEIGTLDDACRLWREQIVWPLRAVRSSLKTGPSPAPGLETGPLRLQVKALELAAEQLENRLLAQRLPLRPPRHERVEPEQLRAVLNDVVACFAGERGTKAAIAVSSSIG